MELRSGFYRFITISLTFFNQHFFQVNIHNLARSNQKSGFTLVEILIVVTIIGVLAAIAVSLVERVRVNSQNSRLANDFRAYSGIVEVFVLEKGSYPENADPGTVPPGLDQYVDPGQWDQASSIGGIWDVEYSTGQVLSAIGVQGYTVPNDQILQFDEKYDDGDLTTGTYRQLNANHYYYVVAE